MQPKRPNYGKYALQAFVIFGGLHALMHGPLLVPWLAEPVGWQGLLLGVVEQGTLGVVIVTFAAWATYKIMALRAQP